MRLQSKNMSTNNVIPMTQPYRVKRQKECQLAIRQALWKASQYFDLNELERYCYTVIDEIAANDGA